jgi:aspartyl protease family protein
MRIIPVISTLLLSLGLSTVSPVFALDIHVVGLFKNKAIIKIDGRRVVLEVGETTDDGVKLVNADSKNCTLLINNEPQVFEMGSQLSVRFKEDTHAKISISKDQQGMYRTQGHINGQKVDFLVDTGASVVALNINAAKKLNLDLKPENITEVETAAGKARAYRLTLRKISVGNITLYDIPAVVVDGNAPLEILLGMSFLQHLKIEDTNQSLELTKKF